jgi:polyphosphate kinase
MTLRTRLLEMIERETANARAGTPSKIVMKMNALVDNQAIEALYEASKAGVEIDLIVRGACCLVPGVPGVSETIRVRSIVGEFLEHSRVWMFGNAGRPEWYMGSADLMERNLDRRVEVVTPVEDIEAQARLDRFIEVMLADDRRSWQLTSAGEWVRTEVLQSSEGTVEAFAVLKDDAATASASADFPRAHAAAGSMDPRA